MYKGLDQTKRQNRYIRNSNDLNIDIKLVNTKKVMYVETVERLNGRTDLTRVEPTWQLVIVFHISGLIFPNLRLQIVNLRHVSLIAWQSYIFPLVLDIINQTGPKSK